MAQPTPYDRQNSFTTLASINPDIPYAGADLDEEFNALKVTLDEILANLELIQRDDGFLGNGTVGPDQLAASLDIGINPPSAWTTATAYSLYDTVFNSTSLYKATVAHTSGSDFATDLAAGSWVLLADFNTVAIDDGSVTTAKLADLAVTAAKLAANAVTTVKIFDDAVTTAKILDGNVTLTKLATNSVSTVKIQDTAITTAKLADAALIAIAALTPAADRLSYFTSATEAALATLTAAGRALLDDADAAAQRATLGLTNVAYLDVVAQSYSGGVRVVDFDNGTKSSGTFTPDPGNGANQKATFNGALTLAPGTNQGSYWLDVTNGASAGAITTSGWTKVIGAFDTTNGHKFACMCKVSGLGSLLTITAMQ